MTRPTQTTFRQKSVSRPPSVKKNNWQSGGQDFFCFHFMFLNGFIQDVNEKKNLKSVKKKVLVGTFKLSRAVNRKQLFI